MHKNSILENFRLGAKNVHKPPLPLLLTTLIFLTETHVYCIPCSYHDTLWIILEMILVVIMITWHEFDQGLLGMLGQHGHCAATNKPLMAQIVVLLAGALVSKIVKFCELAKALLESWQCPRLSLIVLKACCRGSTQRQKSPQCSAVVGSYKSRLKISPRSILNLWQYRFATHKVNDAKITLSREKHLMLIWK